MITDLNELLNEEGYLYLKVQPEEIGMYYTYENSTGEVKVILGVLDHEGFDLTKEAYEGIREHVQGLFYLNRGNVPGISDQTPVSQVNILFLVVTENVEKYRTLCNQMNGIWVADTRKNRLIIYENQPGHFDDMERKIPHLMRQPETLKGEDQRELYTLFIRENGVMNFILVGINILVWLGLTMLGDTNSSEFLVEHGAMYTPFIMAQHEYFRLFTSMFIHIGALHLLNNMVMLFFTGGRLEKEVGRMRFLFIYILSGIGGNLVSMCHSQIIGRFAVGAGASGAIFGVVGALFAIALKNHGKVGSLSSKGLLFMIALCLWGGITTVGVDNWCHMGGLLTGFLLTYSLYRTSWRKN